MDASRCLDETLTRRSKKVSEGISVLPKICGLGTLTACLI